MLGVALWLVIQSLGARSLDAQAQAVGPALRARETYTITVKDQFGVRTPGVTVMARCYNPNDLHTVQGVTNALGEVYLQLDPQRRYSCSVYYRDGETTEYWRYDYVYERICTTYDCRNNDWNPPRQTYQRRDPWISGVTLPAEPVPVGQPIRLVATVGHGFPLDKSFGLFLRAYLWVDDDGQPPYLFQALSPDQAYVRGYQPFQFSYTPAAAGSYTMRVLLERKWEGDEQGWLGSDEGGWSWSLTVAPEPCSIAGRVFGDLNRDGAYQWSDTYVAGAQVLLYDDEGVEVAQELTDGLGHYRFSELAPGLHLVALGQVPDGLAYDGRHYEQECAGGASYEGFDFPLGLWYLGLPLVYVAQAP
ncbi:MAG: SdrD B-like domain-containing protein [Chloroflexota bacterium]